MIAWFRRLPSWPTCRELAHIYYLTGKARFLTWWTGRKHDFLAQVTVPNPMLRWPRNTVCFCGSGRKFKKCHMHKVPSMILRSEANEFIEIMQFAEQRFREAQ